MRPGNRSLAGESALARGARGNRSHAALGRTPGRGWAGWAAHARKPSEATAGPRSYALGWAGRSHLGRPLVRLGHTRRQHPIQPAIQIDSINLGVCSTLPTAYKRSDQRRRLDQN
jgi:hypothetical protein